MKVQAENRAANGGVAKRVSEAEFHALIEQFKKGERPKLHGMEVDFPVRIKQRAGLSIKCHDGQLHRDSKAWATVYFDSQWCRYVVACGRNKTHTQDFVKAQAPDALVLEGLVAPWNKEFYQSHLSNVRENYAALPDDEKVRRWHAKRDKVINVDGRTLTFGEWRKNVNQANRENDVGGRRTKELQRKKRQRDTIRNMHDQCLFAEIASENSTLMQQFTELKRMHNLSLYSQSQRRELRDKIMTSKYRCLQWTNKALIPTGKFVSIHDLTNPDNFDEVYAGFSRWAPHTPGYRLEASSVVRYTYGREAYNMYVLDVANDLPLYEAGGDKTSVEAFVQAKMRQIGVNCLHGEVYRTANGGSYTEEEKTLRKTLVEDGFSDASAKRFIALKRAAETRGNIFVSCFPKGKGGWQGKTLRKAGHPGERTIPVKTGIDLVRRNAHYDNVASTSTRPRPRNVN